MESPQQILRHGLNTEKCMKHFFRAAEQSFGLSGATGNDFLRVKQESDQVSVAIQADGHCMYRAVQDQLEASDDNPELDYTELRQETASYMRAFPDNFLPFINQARYLRSMPT